MLNPTPSDQGGSTIVVWDVQTGVVISDIVIEFRRPYGIEFCGNETIILISERNITLCTYDVLKGTQLSEVVVSPLRTHKLLTHWVHRKSFLFATSSETGGKIMIDIQTLQPTSNPPFLAVESFPVPRHKGIFSFSPISFHASFLIDWEIFILDVRDSKILLRIEAMAQPGYSGSGRFSPDGRFFAYITRDDDVCVWKSTPAGYVPWSSLRPRFPPGGDGGFVFSPTATSILSWGVDGIQLLDNHLRPPPPNKVRPARQSGIHLVACSTDGTRIATAQRGGDVVTILGLLSDAPKQYIDTDMRIRDIKILDNDVFALDEHALVSWNLEGGAQGARRVTLGGALAPGVYLSAAEHAILSNDCARIAIVTCETVLLYDILAQEVLNECTVDNILDDISDIQFSPDGCQLWLTLDWTDNEVGYQCVTLDTMDDWRSVNLVTWELPEDGRSRDGCFPLGYRVRVGSGWVEDPRGRKLLWLPPDCRTEDVTDARWDDNFLVLVRTGHPEPVIVKFHP